MIANRRLAMSVHGILAVGLSLLFLAHQKLSLRMDVFSIVGRTWRVGLLTMPVWLPMLFSSAYSVPHVTQERARTWIFLISLGLTATAFTVFLVGRQAQSSVTLTVATIVAATLVYLVLATLILERKPGGI